MITVSIVTYKTDVEELKQCLNSLTSPIIKTIYVVDNSEQTYLAELCRHYSRVVYIGSSNVGYGSGHNKALRLALDDKDVTYHLVLNSDVYFEPAILDKIAEYMDQNTDVAQLQPYVLYPDGSLQETVRLLPTPADLIARRFLPSFLKKRLNYRYTLLFWDHKKPINIPNHQGSFMFFRLSAVEKVGLFDENFFLYSEDIDMTRRMHQSYRTMYWPEVSIVHAHRAASYKNNKMLLIHMWNLVKYFNKWGWFFDSERKKLNKQILEELNYKGYQE